MDEDWLLSEALAPMKDSDKEDYKAWVEMESDPVRSFMRPSCILGQAIWTDKPITRPTSVVC